jgi:hypothetical protein
MQGDGEPDGERVTAPLRPTRPPCAGDTSMAKSEDMTSAARSRRGSSRRLTVRSRTKLVAAAAVLPVILILFLSQAIGSSDASFVSRSYNPGALFTSGSVSLTNSKSGVAVVSATGLLPGSSANGELSLTAHGNYRLSITLRNAGITDNPASPALSEALALLVEDVTDIPRTVWSGTMASLTSVSLGQLSPGSTATFRFTVSFPAANAMAGLQNTNTSMTLRFTGVAQ